MKPNAQNLNKVFFDSYKEADFESNLNWQMFMIMAEFVEGFEFLAGLKREVTFFGSARFPKSNKYYKQAKELGFRLGNAGFTVITGGGPGIMQAANEGAYKAGAESVGLNIQLPFEQRINPYVTKSIAFHYFFTRKVMMSVSSQAYVFYPGGYGTLDEFFEMVALVRLGIVKDTPIILVGKNFWEPIIEFLKSNVCQELGAINKEDLNSFVYVEDNDEAFAILEKTQERDYIDTQFVGEKFDFGENANWRIFRIMAEFVRGFHFMSKFENPVALLGSGEVKENDEYYDLARSVAKQLGEKGHSIVTGGGPGIMEGANRGAMEASANSIGLDRMEVGGERMNKYVKSSLGFHYYFTRKIILSASSESYIFFPGGYGTLDDFFDLLTLIQTEKLRKMPVILVGKEFWQPIITFLTDIMYGEHKAINKEDLDLFQLVDNVEDACNLAFCAENHKK